MIRRFCRETGIGFRAKSKKDIELLRKFVEANFKLAEESVADGGIQIIEDTEEEYEVFFKE